LWAFKKIISVIKMLPSFSTKLFKPE
jgi:hypothetical protein